MNGDLQVGGRLKCLQAAADDEANFDGSNTDARFKVATTSAMVSESVRVQVTAICVNELILRISSLCRPEAMVAALAWRRDVADSGDE